MPSIAPTGRITSAAMPDSNASRRAVEVLEAEQRVHVQHPHRLGVLSATSSTSMPPIRESIAIGFFAERSNTIAA